MVNPLGKNSSVRGVGILILPCPSNFAAAMKRIEHVFRVFCRDSVIGNYELGRDDIKQCMALTFMQRRMDNFFP